MNRTHLRLNTPSRRSPREVRPDVRDTKTKRSRNDYPFTYTPAGCDIFIGPNGKNVKKKNLSSFDFRADDKTIFHAYTFTDVTRPLFILTHCAAGNKLDPSVMLLWLYWRHPKVPEIIMYIIVETNTFNYSTQNGFCSRKKRYTVQSVSVTNYRSPFFGYRGQRRTTIVFYYFVRPTRVLIEYRASVFFFFF